MKIDGSKSLEEQTDVSESITGVSEIVAFINCLCEKHDGQEKHFFWVKGNCIILVQALIKASLCIECKMK